MFKVIFIPTEKIGYTLKTTPYAFLECLDGIEPRDTSSSFKECINTFLKYPSTKNMKLANSLISWITDIGNKNKKYKELQEKYLEFEKWTQSFPQVTLEKKNGPIVVEPPKDKVKHKKIIKVIKKVKIVKKPLKKVVNDTEPATIN